jgi:hypothetical protein
MIDEAKKVGSGDGEGSQEGISSNCGVSFTEFYQMIVSLIWFLLIC